MTLYLQYTNVVNLPYVHVHVHVLYRHWQKLSEELGMNIQPKATFTFSKCLEMGLDSHVEAIAKVAEVASKEFSIEQVKIHKPHTLHTAVYLHALATL